MCINQYSKVKIWLHYSCMSAYAYMYTGLV